MRKRCANIVRRGDTYAFSEQKFVFPFLHSLFVYFEQTKATHRALYYILSLHGLYTFRERYVWHAHEMYQLDQ